MKFNSAPMKTEKMIKKHLLGQLTVNEVQEYLKTNQTVILPYGVVEQHGFHLPLDTDIRNATYMGEQIAKALGVVMAPTVNYCFSGGMLAGTINIKPNTFSNLMGEIIESLHLQGFRNFIILSGHGGSESFLHLKESLRILKWMNPSLHDAMILLPPLWEFSPTWLSFFQHEDYHAADAETSLLLHWCPEVVRSKVVIDEEPIFERMKADPDAFQLRTTLSSLQQEIPNTSQRDEVKVGVMGDPSGASKETGQKINDEILENMVPAICEAILQATQSRISHQQIEIADNSRLKILGSLQEKNTTK